VETLRILLDTSAFSGFMRGDEGAVTAVRQAEELVLTPIVLGELLSGFLAGGRERHNRELLARFLESPRVRIEPMDGGTAERYAAIHAYLRSRGTPVPTNDLWIAAVAMQHGLTVATTDRHFANIPQILCLLLP
jgi:predicted nucleic acid-binding protein